MANQAYSEASDLMVGAGRVYFQRFDDPNQIHFLGNVSEFNITTDVTTVEKFSSMNKKRELMASVTTQTQASGSMVLNEYNMYNLALGLYGIESVHHQDNLELVNYPYVVPSVPGVIELKDPDGIRYTNVSNVRVAPLNQTDPRITFNRGDGVSDDGTVFTDDQGGMITLGFNGNVTGNFTAVLRIDQAPLAPGDLLGLRATMATSLLNLNLGNVTNMQVTQSMTQENFAVSGVGGMWVRFSVGAGDTFTQMPAGSYLIVNISQGVTQYEENKDFTVEDECLRAGLINITKNSRINSGDVVLISCSIPDDDYVTVSGASAGKIEGSLLFTGDPNQGNALMIEAWLCNIRPDGDLTGLISEDFGEFTLNFNIMSDYEHHPDYPLFKVTKLAENTDKANKKGVYDPLE